MPNSHQNAIMLNQQNENGHSFRNGNRNGNRNGFQTGNGHQLQNGTVPLEHFHPYRDMTPSIQDLSLDENLTPEPQRHMTHADHIRQLSASTSQKFVDTLSRVHSPPPKTRPPPVPAPEHFASNYLAKTLSQEPEEPLWNPAEMLNARGHMTNSNPVGRSDSFMSTESSNSMEFHGPSQLERQRQGVGILSPLHKGHFANERAGGQSSSGNPGDSYLTHVDHIRMMEMKKGQRLGSGRSRGSDDVDLPLSELDLRGSPLVMEDYSARHQQPRGIGTGLGVGHVASYGPDQVHMSHSRSIYHPGSPTHPDPGYAVPPSRHQQQQLQQQTMLSQQDDNVYKHPPPAYAAPPPPQEDEEIGSPLSPPQASQVHTFQFTKTTMPAQQQATPTWEAIPMQSRARISSPTPQLSPPPQQAPPPPQQATPTWEAIPMQSRARVSSPTPQFSPPPQQAPPPQVLQSATLAVSEKRLHVLPLKAPPTNTPLQHQQSAPALNSNMSTDRHTVDRHADNMHQRSFSIDQHSSSNMRHQRSSSMESSQSASEVRRLHVLPLNGGQPTLPPPTQPPTQGLHASSGGSNNQSTSSLDESVQSGWSLDRIMRSMEQKANSFDNMLAPLEENPEDTSVHMTSGQLAPPHLIPANPPSIRRPQVAPKPPKVAKKPTQPPQKAPKPSALSHTPNSEVIPKASHAHLPKATSPPPDIIPSSNGHHGYSSDEDPTSIAINKKRPKVPDLTTMDPRKPKLKVKKVPRSVWQPRPMTHAIQSSSSESDSEGSEYSVDTVIMGGAVDTSTLKSAHV